MTAAVIAMVGIAHPAPVGACDVLAPSTKFVGTAVDVDGDIVAYEVESLLPFLGHPDSWVDPNSPGDRVEVSYDRDDSRFIDVGDRYSVEAWDIGGGFNSVVHRAEDITCGGIEGTVRADGSLIDTGYLTLNRFEPWWVAAVAVPVLAVACLLHRVTASRRERGRTDRVTDGEGALPSAVPPQSGPA